MSALWCVRLREIPLYLTKSIYFCLHIACKLERAEACILCFSILQMIFILRYQALCCFYIACDPLPNQILFLFFSYFNRLMPCVNYSFAVFKIPLACILRNPSLAVFILHMGLSVKYSNFEGEEGNCPNAY